MGGEALSQILPLLCPLLGNTERQRPLVCFAIGLVMLLTMDMSLALGSIRDLRSLSFKLQSPENASP